MLLVVGSCAAGSAMVRTATTAVPGADNGTDDGTPPPVQQPPAEPATCIPVHAGECLPAEEFEAAAEVLAEGYRAHPNFQTQWGLSHIRADSAYAYVNQLEGVTVAPGAGVTIGFIDSGIDQGHADFAGKTITEVFISSATADERGDRFSHGTAVASVAAGIRNLHEDSAHGVAWGADIAMFAIPLGTGDGEYVPISLTALASVDEGWGALFDFVVGWRHRGNRVDILNLSIGFDGVIDGYGEQELRDSFATTIAAMAQADAADKTILVWAAGNAHGSMCDPAIAHCIDGKLDAVSVELLPGLAARIAELQGHSVAVVALKEDGTIADFSNRCGIAADHCIAAPGEAVRAAYLGPHRDTNAPSRGYADVAGTSMAAPFVAGGLAVMKHLFRDQLASTDLVARLLATANADGIYADRAVYGRGAMDLQAATWPVGVLDVPVGGTRVDGPAVSLAATRLRAGAAFGDGIERSLSGREIAAFDTFGAPFWFDLGDLTATAAARGLIAEPRVHGYESVPFPAPGSSAGSHWRVGFLEQPAGVAGGHLTLAEPALGLTVTDRRALTGTAFTTEGVSVHPPVSGAAVWWRPADSAFGLRAGWLREPGSMLGSTGDGAFGTLAGETAFAGTSAEAALGPWSVAASAEVGTADATSRGGIVAEVTPVTTSAATISARRPFAGGGTLRVSISQPLRVESGTAMLTVPAGRTKEGEVVRRPFTVDLTPSGRQIDVTAEWNQPLQAGELRVGAVVTHQRRHRADAAPEFRVRGGWRWQF